MPKCHTVEVRLSTKDGCVLRVPMVSFEAGEKANEVAKMRTAALNRLIEARLVVGGEDTGVTVRELLADLGLAGIAHGVASFEYESESMIQVPRFNPRLA